MHPVPSTGLGVCVGSFAGAPDSLAERLADLGVGTVRLDVYTFDDGYARRLDGDLARCSDNGLIPYVTVHDHPALWKERRVLDGIARVHALGAAVGVWNEPNLDGPVPGNPTRARFFSGTVEDYATLWSAVCQRIGAVPIGPELAHDGGGGESPSMWRWLETWWDLIPDEERPSVVTAHFYNPWPTLSGWYEGLVSIVGPDPEIWITEHGTANPTPGLDERRRHLRDCLEVCDQKPMLTGIQPFHAYAPPEWAMLEALDVYRERGEVGGRSH